jgi:hypothetical protein
MGRLWQIERAFRIGRRVAELATQEQGEKETSGGAAFHLAIRFGSLIGNDDLFVLYHGSSFAKQNRATKVGLFVNPTITLPPFLAQPKLTILGEP